MLDNIKSIDSNNFFKSIKDFPKQIEEVFQSKNTILKNKDSLEHSYENILFCGMGGSAIAGDLLKSMLVEDMKIPIVINRDYSVPNWLSKSTLVILSSYSGNTEEVLSCYSECINRGNKPIIISSNGKLLKNAKKIGDSYALIPKGLMPRAALGYSISILFKILNEITIINFHQISKLKKTIVSLKKDSVLYSKIDSNNKAILLAKEIHNSFNLIYTSNNMEVIGMRFRAQLAENAKMLSSHFVFPEQNHNEIEGFINTFVNKLNILWVYDQDSHNKILKRMEITSSILQGKVKKHIIKSEGETFIERELRLIYFLDWVSFYCAIFNNVNPYPVDSISKLKSLL
ncbi:MAG: bifunctional phosphoglucose/phosphomannose isomerase [Candidatus Marinimicrobia bacterium]|nr:bifunctional phosphoglucose/phosphomannose isomerase [Candidatus Neomarinimicrobiota bacterium]|tara:strand:+ start:15194 stop:16225 length:1032 start_codon:yes stop_codon:yes gene_type:complete